MNAQLQHLVSDGKAAELRLGELTLLRYVFHPDTSQDESPRPYVHPLRSLSGEVLTNFRPNDHRWHHGLSFTINSVSGHNFWGGGSYRKEDGYQWRADHGSQLHVKWLDLSPQRMAHALEWRTGGGELLLEEERALEFSILSPSAWSLRWKAVARNVTARTLQLGQYHSNQGLKGSHYTGLQFRGARDLLDDHGDKTIGIRSDGGLEGEEAVHASAGCWMEWRCQKDTSQRRVTIRFENNNGAVHWFVRRNNPLAAIPFQYEHDLPLDPGAALEIDSTLTFTDE